MVFTLLRSVGEIFNEINDIKVLGVSKNFLDVKTQFFGALPQKLHTASL
jgi:hypothetical protein